MEIISDIVALRTWRREMAAAGKSLALVPTMGFFHQGHLSLMRRAGELADLVAVSLFVNPIQFAPGEDLDRYPRDLERDRKEAEGAGVDLLFVPDVADMYPAGADVRVVPGSLADVLCGASRPGHFEGVCTVVAKLFNLVQPQMAIFGRKDFQQLAIIEQMTRDLNFPVEIIAHPIVREADGLAMSSRNSYLDKEERAQAVCLVEALRLAVSLYRRGEKRCSRIIAAVEELLAGYPLARPEYISLVDRRTLAPRDLADRDTLMALAVEIGGTRLIDNTILNAEDL